MYLVGTAVQVLANLSTAPDTILPLYSCSSDIYFCSRYAMISMALLCLLVLTPFIGFSRRLFDHSVGGA